MMGVTSQKLPQDMGTGATGALGPRFHPPPAGSWHLAGAVLDVRKPVVMGILNLTPDSFSDGGDLGSTEEALARALDMVEEGAGILDVGGESTRPGAQAVSPEEELERVLPFLRLAAPRLPIPVSVDTRRAEVAREALKAGARIVNDVSGLRSDPDLARAVSRAGGALVLSHMRGTPATMKEEARYGDVVAEVVAELQDSLSMALDAGIPPERIVVDPGIGFAKTGIHNLVLLRELRGLARLGRPILVGPSRKSFIGELTGAGPKDRTPGTLAACVVAYLQGARIFRVHDVGPAVQALAVARAIGQGEPKGANSKGE